MAAGASRGLPCGMTTYRFLDGLGHPLLEREFADHTAVLGWAAEEDQLDDEVQRVEYLGPDGDWRWAGRLLG